MLKKRYHVKKIMIKLKIKYLQKMPFSEKVVYLQLERKTFIYIKII